MKITTVVRTLAGASLLALAVTGKATGHANAEPNNPPKNDVTCAVPGQRLHPPSTNDWEFFLPGDVVVAEDDKGGAHIVKCGEDGNWYETRVGPASGGGVAQTLGGGTRAR